MAWFRMSTVHEEEAEEVLAQAFDLACCDHLLQQRRHVHRHRPHLGDIMFKKPFTSSSSPTLLRSSDSRRLILEIATAFSCQAGLINGWLDNKGFLVEQCRSHLDERFTLYSAAATNDPWCFRVDSTLFPSVYFLDLLASSSPLPFPCLVTNTTVLSNLISGEARSAGLPPAPSADLPDRQYRIQPIQSRSIASFDRISGRTNGRRGHVVHHRSRS